ncbi:MAG: DUF4197 domain-containing protein [Pseudomonadota bacterium]
MKAFRNPIIILIILLVSLQATLSLAGLEDFLKGVKKAAGLGEGLSESKIVEGLKEALQIGTKNAVDKVSNLDGFYKNPGIRIPLPDQVQKAEKALRLVGFGSQVDAFELSMNRAAEQAAPRAKALFWDAIKQMTFSDARKILHGADNEATLYFKEKTHDQLGQILRPIIRKSMSQVGVTRSYQDLEARVRTLPFAEALRLDLDQYVTDKSLSGLFFMLAEEERKIRQDPAARVTDLLKDVFGSLK